MLLQANDMSIDVDRTSLRRPTRRCNHPGGGNCAKRTPPRIRSTTEWFMVIVAVGTVISASKVVVCDAWRNFIVEMTHVSVEHNRSWLDVSRSSIDRVHNKTVLDVQLTVLKDIPVVWAHSTIVFISPDMNDQLEMLNTSVNVCQFFATKRRGSHSHQILDNVARHGFIFKECPIKAQTYFVHHLGIDENLFPPYTPESHFEMQTQWYLQKDDPIGSQIFGARLTGLIDKSKSIDNFKEFTQAQYSTIDMAN